MPAWLGGAVAQLAAASYMAYLAHPLVLHLTKFVLPARMEFFRDNVPASILFAYLGTLADGLIGAGLWQYLSKLALDLFGRKAAA